MGHGAPDYTRITEIKGLSPTATLVTIAVDADGQLYAVVKGQYGSTLLPIAVDSSGQMIMVPRGQSGTYLDVDASGFLTSVMKGVDGVTLRTIAVDANGKILGVLQGDYLGTLTTLAVDSQGRMLAVLSDPEDVFGNPHYMGAAELAARLGSIVTYERRGQVVFMDDFENGDAPWLPHAVGASGEYYLSSGEARSGRFSYRIRATGGAGTRQDIDRYSSVLHLTKLAVEFSVSADSSSNIIQLYWEIWGTLKGIYAGLQIDVENGDLYYLNSAGGWTLLAADFLMFPETSLFTTFKLVVDPNAQKYVRLLAADRTYDLSAISAQTIGASPQPYTLIHLGQLGKATTITAIWLDDVILTQNEPA